MNPTVTLLVQLEHDLCQALLTGDGERLKQLMHPDLFHVHAHGNVGSFASYTASGDLKSSYTTVRRFNDLKVQVFGNAAL